MRAARKAAVPGLIEADEVARIDALARQVREAEDAMNAAVAQMGARLAAGDRSEEAERAADAAFERYDALAEQLVAAQQAFLAKAA